MNGALSGLVIAEAGAEAIDPVMEVMNEAFDPAFGEAWNKAQCLGILGLPGVWLTLASIDGRASGFTLTRVIMDDAELLLIAVSPRLHGRGLGTSLIENTVSTAILRGATRMHLEVREGNSAIELYRRSGFLPIGRRSTYYRGKFGQCFDALTFSRSITTPS